MFCFSSKQPSVIVSLQAVEDLPSLSVTRPEAKMIILSLISKNASNPSHEGLHEGLSKYEDAHASQVNEYHATAHSANRVLSVCMSKWHWSLRTSIARTEKACRSCLASSPRVYRVHHMRRWLCRATSAAMTAIFSMGRQSTAVG